jgi:hypothetical protein
VVCVADFAGIFFSSNGSDVSAAAPHYERHGPLEPFRLGSDRSDPQAEDAGRFSRLEHSRDSR